MQVRCPHCKHAIELLNPQDTVVSSCPSCDSRLSFLDDDDTLAYNAAGREISQFRLIERVGVGSFGAVWKARDRSLDRTVAVKLPRGSTIDSAQFLREARAAAQMDHPNIVKVHEVGLHEDRPYIVTEFIDGVTLDDWLREHTLTAIEAATFCKSLAEAVHHAHESHVIHRDLKPGNIMLDSNGTLHVTDFGLAKRDSGEITVTTDGQIIGTPAYMSPEQARGDSHHVDRRSDVYSLGVILYRMTTGQRPFEGSTRMLLHQVLTEEPRQPRRLNASIPRDLETICTVAMAKNPDRRYQTAGDFAADLQRFIDGEPIVQRPVSSLEKLWRRILRNPGISAAWGCAAVAILALVYIVSTHDGTSVTTIRSTPVPPFADGHLVRIVTDPPGASVAIVPLHETTHRPVPDGDTFIRPEGRTPLECRLAPGRYIVEAVIDEQRFHQVHRTVPKDPGAIALDDGYKHYGFTRDGQRVVLPTIAIPDSKQTLDSMVLVEGGQFADDSEAARLADLLEIDALISSFYVAMTEVSVAQYEAHLGMRPTDMPTDADPLSPVSFVTWDQAIAFCEATGTRLPWTEEWMYVTDKATTTVTTSDPWIFGDVLSPKDRTPDGVLGLRSNVGEWAADLPTPGEVPFIVYRVNGIPRSVLYGETVMEAVEAEMDPFHRCTEARTAKRPALGFRVFRSAKPQWVMP